jgi:hypothetical protein
MRQVIEGYGCKGSRQKDGSQSARCRHFALMGREGLVGGRNDVRDTRSSIGIHCLYRFGYLDQKQGGIEMGTLIV